MLMAAILGDNCPLGNGDNCPDAIKGGRGYCPDMSPDAYKQNLRAALDREGLTVAELERRAELPEGTVKKMLQRETSWPRLDTALKIARAIGVTVEEMALGPSAPGVLTARLASLSDQQREAVRQLLTALGA